MAYGLKVCSCHPLIRYTSNILSHEINVIIARLNELYDHLEDYVFH